MARATLIDAFNKCVESIIVRDDVDRLRYNKCSNRGCSDDSADMQMLNKRKMENFSSVLVASLLID